MLFESVEIPEPVLEALQHGKLVVFAGAGVSMGEPANYPSFSKLAKDINQDTLSLPTRINEKNKEEWTEDIDRFLGRLEDATAINVKKEACNLLSQKEAKPTILHQTLLRLFKTPEKLRIVTTNFDPLFNDYASELWKTNNPEYYYAPALPLGNDFNGIVYLHGSVLKNEKHIVITDKDFGRAYLTEGWARNFLQAMFSEYTILFIGYSYNDPVIPYLTRGLPPRLNHSNFAFISDGENWERWKNLGIQPIKYPINDSNTNRHEALGLCLQSWVEYTQKGVLDHERRIQEIVSLPSPPLEPKDLSYIENLLKNVVTAKHFTRYCNRTLDWLYWVDKQGVFNELFQLNSSINDISYHMSWWLAQYILDYSEEILRFIKKKGNILNRQLWISFFDKIWRGDNARMEPKIFLEWIIFLLNDCQVQYESNIISYIFEKCEYPDDKKTALLLFEYLTKPQLSASQEISLVGDNYWLKEAWRKFFQPNLSGLSINLEPIVTNHLQKASWIANSIYRDHENFCFLNSSRHTIETNEDGYDHGGVDILIDAARDIIENLLIDHSDCANGVIEKWNLSGIPILQRFAIHGIIKNIQMCSDEKIEWLIDNKYITNYCNFENEIYRLLKFTYLSSSACIRSKLLKEIENFYYPGNTKIQSGLWNDEYFRILTSLHKFDADCDLVVEKLEIFKQEFPNFQIQEYSAMPYLSLNITEVLGKSLEDPENIDWLLSYDERNDWGSRRGNLLNIIQKITTQNFDWSWQLSQILKDKQKWNSDLWRKILLGWQNTKFTEQQWQSVLDFLVESNLLCSINLDIIANLLDTRQEQTEIPSSCFPLAKQFANNLWKTCENYHETIPNNFDWIQKAINHPSGKITLFWLRTLSKEQPNLEKDNISIIDEYQANFKKILEGNYYAAELGRVILCTQLNFLFSLDLEWTQTNIIPLFNWSTDKKQAQQAWHGFLWQGRTNELILPRLLPFYKQSFAYVSTDLGYHNISTKFLDHLVYIISYAPNSLFDSESQGRLSFIFDFLRKVDSNIKKLFASTICFFLRNTKEDLIKSQWNEWLKLYWEERNKARPLAIEIGELEAMMEWLIYLKPVFSEAVDLFCESPISAENHLLESFVIYRLEKAGDYAILYPEALTKLLLHLLKNTQLNYVSSFNYIENIFHQLLQNNAPHQELRNVCNELSRLGCPNALELNQNISI